LIRVDIIVLDSASGSEHLPSQTTIIAETKPLLAELREDLQRIRNDLPGDPARCFDSIPVRKHLKRLIVASVLIPPQVALCRV
jgi:hypothetical protein